MGKAKNYRVWACTSGWQNCEVKCAGGTYEVSGCFWGTGLLMLGQLVWRGFSGEPCGGHKGVSLVITH